MSEPIKNADLERIATEGQKIYDSIKVQHEPADNGKFLAIDIDSKEVFLASTSAEALELARQKFPNKVFYVVKIGYDAAEILAMSFRE